MLGEVAWIISRMQDKYLSAQYQRMARRRGKQKAVPMLGALEVTSERPEGCKTHLYSFRPVPAKPWTIWRWKKRNAISVGRPPSTAVAMIWA